MLHTRILTYSVGVGVGVDPTPLTKHTNATALKF